MALAFYRGSAWALVPEAQQDVGLVQAAFAGPSMIQLTLVEGALEVSPARPVQAGQKVSWQPTPDSTFGGYGKLDGEEGNFSGDRNRSAPQMFTPWPVWHSAGLNQRFVGQGAGLATGADRPDAWVVTVDGRPSRVVRLLRKSVPIESYNISFNDIGHRVRHLVSLEIDAVIGEGSDVIVGTHGMPLISLRRDIGLVSETVHVCQAGYAASGPKKAYVGLWLGHDQDGLPGSTDPFLSDETEWRLETEAGEVALTGTLAVAKPGDEAHIDGKNFNGCTVYAADFSAVDAPGRYSLTVQGFGRSLPFSIEGDPFREQFRIAARWFFHQRSGCGIASPHGEGRLRPRNGHPEDGLEVIQTGIRLGRTAEGFQVRPRMDELLAKLPPAAPTAVDAFGATAPGWPNPLAWGGWHDAGDWDRRVQHMEAVYAMAMIAETLPSSRAIRLNLPESGKTFADPAVEARRSGGDVGDGITVLPDLIHEALWGASLWRRTQRSDGAILGGVAYSRDGVKGSFSWNPVQQSYALGYEDWASYYFAWAIAKLGHVVATICGDAVLGRSLIDEAEAAWSFAEAAWRQDLFPLAEALYYNDPEESEQGTARQLSPAQKRKLAKDRHAVRMLAQVRWAAAGTLYRASGLAAAREVFEQQNPFLPKGALGAMGALPSVFPDSGVDYLLAGNEGRATDDDIVAAIQDWVRWNGLQKERIGADYGLQTSAAYPWGRGWLRFGPGSNWRAADILLLARLGEASGPDARDIVYEGMWFGTGCNPSNVSFVQGLGSRSFEDPLYLDYIGRERIPGHICFGVAGGPLYDWEQRKVAGTIYPPDQDDWPVYAMIYESKQVAICSEHGIKSNAMHWLKAAALAHHYATELQPSLD